MKTLKIHLGNVVKKRLPGMNGRVDIGKVPFIRRDLAIRLHVPFSR